MNVSVVIPTRGNVDLQPVIDSLPPAWEIVFWDNGERMVTRSDGFAEVCSDLSVYGRYAAIQYATHDLCFTQDDDVIVSDPQAIVDAWMECGADWPDEAEEIRRGLLVANMPQEFRPHYTDSCLVGFGACFHRDLPGRAFLEFAELRGLEAGWPTKKGAEFFNRCCDVVFTTLTPRVLMDVPKVDREFASDPDRMWKQPEHHGERQRMLALARTLA